ncbi:MAG TPA: GNAT family N-acetyltransferase, partial [Alphaproteobacteria bacterium]|nr:GNAT family N-acetyltransferase [Alphaproteobacteria bacterium]
MQHPQNSSFDIRQAAAADAAAIAAVHVQSWRESYQGIVPESHLAGLEVVERTQRWHGQLETLESPSAVFIARPAGGAGGAACGFISCGAARERFEGYAGEVYALYLLKSAQGTGLGRRLFDTARQSLAGCGINGLYLWVL